MPKLNRSDARREHPAILPYLYLALVRLKLRLGAKQLLLMAVLLAAGCHHPRQPISAEQVVWIDETPSAEACRPHEYAGRIYHSKWSRTESFSAISDVWVPNNLIGPDGGGGWFHSLRSNNIGHFPPNSPMWWQGYCPLCGPTGPLGLLEKGK